ncbi:Uncharacterized protein FWK35_00000754 [Aphis craccivora]|uniref:Uncharacterized protein n=1 Tax=Aphis craccivora TaxID=307492 RepID=A0A6G0ZEE9_APHCR|nr:Uncharacterized protein FWK35_00000754 [Aphis craccivora]
MLIKKFVPMYSYNFLITIRITFSTKSIFLYGFNSKTYHCKFLKFSPNVYVSVIYIQLNFQKMLTFFEVFIDHRNFRFF